ncbi:GTPase [Selenomonas ruminantium]|uniref:GTPase n=1 Tax=Selenomonas ruminantium TaxID=971 RepID=UPI0004199925|nr:GTPase [Selenomonas ruminantium]
MNSVLEKELSECVAFAKRGSELADNNYADIKNILHRVNERLEHADKRQGKLLRFANIDLMHEQHLQLRKLEEKIDSIQNDVEMLKKKKKDFSIVIYGRTMAGKSTLMEILTHGTGNSIGKGAQRTTLDVRDYYWQGLKITDVPGICSFDGREDDKLAFEAAKSADLIVFLLTDDAPQAGEAECLAQLRSLGKPVLGIINIKMAFNVNNYKMSLARMQKRLSEKDRIDEVCEQFKAFADNYHQNWKDIVFVPTHLQAAFISQSNSNQEMFQASNFAEVEKFILKKIQQDGKFISFKTFIDSTAVPTQKIIKNIYAQASESICNYLEWKEKETAWSKWAAAFQARATEKIRKTHERLKHKMYSDIDRFVDKHYEDEKAGEKWVEHVKSIKIDKDYIGALQEIAEEYDKKRKEVQDKLQSSLNIAVNTNIKCDTKMDDTTPIAKWVVAIAPNLLLFVPGIGWAARIGISLAGAVIAWLMDDKEAKIKENKGKLKKALLEATNEMLDNMRKSIWQTYKIEIVEKGIYDLKETMHDMSEILFYLAKGQNQLATELCEKYQELNLELLQEAVVYSEQGGFLGADVNIARIPGKDFYAIGRRCKINEERVSELLGEKLLCWATADNAKDCALLIASNWSTGAKIYDYKLEGYKEVIQTLMVDDMSKENEVMMAQQIVKMPVIRSV